jgi:GlpG protein
MRLIGHLADKAGAQAFSDFLCVEGISNELEHEKEGWAIWIHLEEDLERAKTLLTEFQGNPANPKYQNRALEAEQIKHQRELEEAKARNRYFDRAKLFQQVRPYGIGPLSLALVLICVAVTAYTRFAKNIDAPLWITQFSIEGHYLRWRDGLPEIRHGQIWRLITPIFIHANMMHLVFNALAMLDFGSMVESRQNALRLALLVLVIAVPSNVAQYYSSTPHLPNFCGISGVAYGLLGYIWMKSKFHPASGYYLHPQTVAMMLIFFVICLFKWIPNIANTVHSVGLGVGVVWGYLSSVWAKRRGA